MGNGRDVAWQLPKPDWDSERRNHFAGVLRLYARSAVELLKEHRLRLDRDLNHLDRAMKAIISDANVSKGMLVSFTGFV